MAMISDRTKRRVLIASLGTLILGGQTGSYMSGFMVLGALVILGGLALLAYGRIKSSPAAALRHRAA